MPDFFPSSASSELDKDKASPKFFDSSVLDQSTTIWRQRFKKYAKPRILVSAFLATSAFYCFVIGRDRYTAVSEFVIQQAAPLQGTSASVLAGTAAAPQVMTSLVDGQYLQVYLESSDIKNRLFSDSKKFEKVIKQNMPYLQTMFKFL